MSRGSYPNQANMTKKKAANLHKKTGPKGHKPTDEQRGRVRGLAMANIPLDQIAADIGIAEKTLTKKYPDEVKKGRLTLLAGAASNIARMALGAGAVYDTDRNLIRAEIKPELGACCFVLKTQGKKFGWSERVEHTGADGTPLFNDLDLSKLSGKEFQQLATLLRKCGVEVTP